jgi:hypothetical protein
MELVSCPNMTRMVTSRRPVATVGKKVHGYKALVGKREGKRPL